MYVSIHRYKIALPSTICMSKCSLVRIKTRVRLGMALGQKKSAMHLSNFLT